MRAYFKLAFCLSSVALLTAPGSAEPLYVDDKLVLNVYAEADQSSSRVATIETGDAVEGLEHVGNFIRVQLTDGREGWVAANYLKTQPPAIVRLKERDNSSTNSDTKQHTDEIARLKKQNTTLQTEVAELKKKLAAVPVITDAVPAALPPEPREESALETVPTKSTLDRVVVERTFWWAWLIAVVLAGVAGFIAGYQTLGKRVRERFGGVKVY